MQRADRVLYVVDAAAGGPGAAPAALEAQAADLPPGVPVTWVVNKIDLLGLPAGIATDAGGATRIFLSARSGEGLDLLRDHLKTVAGYGSAETGAFSARRRHLDALSRANHLVRNGAATLRSTRAFELFADDLRLAQRALSDITGEITSDDLLGEIFGSFCIGK
jgi:tRNA modification GTPase